MVILAQDLELHLYCNSDLGLGYARYNSSNTTITFVLKQANIDTASDVSTSSGTGVSILNNLADLNGRKYITHRIERADGYSLQFVVRANISEVSASINPTGNQSVVGSNNYVLASLRNSPYGFTKINQSDRFRDGAENIKKNQEFIAEEAVAYVKYYYESSAYSWHCTYYWWNKFWTSSRDCSKTYYIISLTGGSNN